MRTSNDGREVLNLFMRKWFLLNPWKIYDNVVANAGILKRRGVGFRCHQLNHCGAVIIRKGCGDSSKCSKYRSQALKHMERVHHCWHKREMIEHQESKECCEYQLDARSEGVPIINLVERSPSWDVLALPLHSFSCNQNFQIKYVACLATFQKESGSEFWSLYITTQYCTICNFWLFFPLWCHGRQRIIIALQCEKKTSLIRGCFTNKKGSKTLEN